MKDLTLYKYAICIDPEGGNGPRYLEKYKVYEIDLIWNNSELLKLKSHSLTWYKMRFLFLTENLSDTTIFKLIY